MHTKSGRRVQCTNVKHHSDAKERNSSRVIYIGRQSAQDFFNLICLNPFRIV
jgi:hypothetical protein